MKYQAGQRVYIIDDDALVRESLATLLKVREYEVDTYSSAGEFLITDLKSARGCLLLDLKMPDVGGLDLQKCLMSRGCALPVVFISGVGTVSSCVRALKCGALNFLSKPVAANDLFSAVEEAFVFDERADRERSQSKEIARRFSLLSERERIVVKSVVCGRLNKQIAGDLEVSERMVKIYRANAMQKLATNNVAQLAEVLRQVTQLSYRDSLHFVEGAPLPVGLR